MLDKWISREEENNLPRFGSYKEARVFFEKKYGDNFVVDTVELIGEEKCYFCSLIVDRKSFDEMQELLRKGMPISENRFLACAQPIQIMESGSIHIVH